MVTIVAVFAMMEHFSTGANVAPAAQFVIMPEGYCRLPKVKNVQIRDGLQSHKIHIKFRQNTSKDF
jgi:hypothetical protein